MNYDEHFKLSCDKREKFWKSIGELYPDVVASLINPAFMGGPKWPSLRQAHIGIKVKDNTIIASDGLSDPYDDYDTNPENQPYNGLGLELYVVSTSKLNDTQAIINSWELSVLRQVSDTAASNPNLINMLTDYKYISITINGDRLPEGFVDENGSSGVLLGLQSSLVAPKLELSIEKISLVNVILLKTKELQYILDNGAKARVEVAEKLTEQGYDTLVSERNSVI